MNCDTFTQEGASELAARIRLFWAQQGYVVNTDIVSEQRPPGKDAKLVYGVRSDLVNGLPVRP